jgi:hypothetical protein
MVQAWYDQKLISLDSGVPLFQCPACQHRFPKLSGLFIHVESPSCSQSLTDGAMQQLGAFLAKCAR